MSSTRCTSYGLPPLALPIDGVVQDVAIIVDRICVLWIGLEFVAVDFDTMAVYHIERPTVHNRRLYMVYNMPSHFIECTRDDEYTIYVDGHAIRPIIWVGYNFAIVCGIGPWIAIRPITRNLDRHYLWYRQHIGEP